MNNFSVKKAIQVLHYIQSQTAHTDILALLKLCFFADRKMMRTYGLSLLNDDYFAMFKGPVCSKTKNVMDRKNPKEAGFTEEEMTLINDNISPISKGKVYVKDIGDSSLSKFDKDSLEFVISQFKGIKKDDLVSLTHAYPEWNKFEQDFMDLNAKKTIHKRFPMQYEDFFKNPDSNVKIKPYFDKDPFAEPAKVLKITENLFFQKYGRYCNN